jgi:uncharacterized membrane protein YhaH (DUF805 family)
MEFWSVFLIIYMMIALFALYMTHLEQSRKRRPNHGPNHGLTLLGYALCMIWPAIALVLVVLVNMRPAQIRQVGAD